MTPAEKAAAIAKIEARLAAMDKEDAIESTGQSVEDAAIVGLKGGMKGLDYQRGLVQKGLLMLMGREDLLTPEEKEAWKANNFSNMPGYGELMKRAGVDEGATLSDMLPTWANFYAAPGTDSWWPEKGGALDPSLRSTVGMAADVALDPLTYESMGATAAGKVITAQGARAAAKGNLGMTLKDRFRDLFAEGGLKGAISRIGAPTKNLAEYGGKSMYRSAFRPLDEAAVRVGQAPFSELALQKGMRGGWPSMEEQHRMLRDAAEAKARGAVDKLESLDPMTVELAGYSPVRTGGTDMQAAMTKSRAQLGTMDQRPVVADIQAALEKQIGDIERLGNVPRQKAMQNKSDLYSAAPNNAFEVDAHVTPGGGVRKQAARGIKEEITKVSPWARDQKAAAKAAAEVDPLMEEWGRYLTTKNDAASLAHKEASRPMLSRTEKMGAAGISSASAGGTDAGLAFLAQKKALDAATATPARTWGGWALDRYANKFKGAPASFVDGSLRQNVILDPYREQFYYNEEQK